MSNEKSVSEAGCAFRLEISGGFLILLSLTWFLCGGKALLAAFLAAAVHEQGHLILIIVQGSIPIRLTLDISGACLRCSGAEPNALQELTRAIAGPVSGLLLWLILRRSPDEVLRITGEMSLMLSLINLLPAPGLDGGRVLDCLAPHFLNPVLWDRISGWLGFLSAFLTLILGFLHSPQLFLYGLWLLLRQLRIRMRN